MSPACRTSNAAIPPRLAAPVAVGEATAEEHAGVVAEQEGTQRRDGGDGAQGALLARGRGLLDELAHLIRRVVVDRWSVRHLRLLLLLYWSYQGD